MTKLTKNQRIFALEVQVKALLDKAKLNEPQPKQLDQSVFDGQDENRRFFAIDENGEGWFYRGRPEIAFQGKRWLEPNHTPVKLADGYDTANWQNSLIERESKELTGSELCRVMLERGDKYVMCHVGTHNIYTVIITGMCGTSFEVITNDVTYTNPKPINNKGELLTAEDVGL